MSLMAGNILLSGHSDLYFTPAIAWTVAVAAVIATALGLIQLMAIYQRFSAPTTHSCPVTDLPAAGTPEFTASATRSNEVMHDHANGYSWRESTSPSQRASVSPLMQTAFPSAAPTSWVGHALLLLFALPIALGIFVPPVVLGATSIALREANITMIHAPGTGIARRSVLLHTDLLHLQALAQQTSQFPHSGGRSALLRGQQIDLIGFVYHQSDLPPDTFLLTRFITPHCVAEAQPLAILVRVTPAQASALKDNIWLHVYGTLTGTALNGHAVAELISVYAKRIPAPADPYLVY
jgi:uncharacterized repeat protein (TIGR03943 family)